MIPDESRMPDRLRAGEDSALNELVTVLYDELRRIAAHQLRGERAAHTLQTTALVHEAYLKLVGDPGRSFTDRAHFLSVASRVMRQVLVDYARARATRKRSAGGRMDGLALEEERIEVEPNHGLDAEELLDLDCALTALAAEDENLTRIVEMRYFGGMTAEETGEVLGRSVHVVRHDLRLAQAWLRRTLSRRGASGSSPQTPDRG